MSRLSILALFLSIPIGSAQAQAAAPQTLLAGQAIHHLDQPATVCGVITGRHTLAGAGTLIDLGVSAPSPSAPSPSPPSPSAPDPPAPHPAAARPAFRIVIWNTDSSKVGDLPSAGTVCVTGTIGQAQGIPQIVLADAKNWALHAPSHPPPVPATAPAARTAPTPHVASAPSTAPTSSKAPAPSTAPTSNKTPAPSTAPASRPTPTVSTADAPHPAPASAPAPPPAAIASFPGYRIGPDDSLQVTVWQEPTLSGVFLVRPDGMISLVLVGDVPAAGLTPMQLAGDLTQRLKKFLKDPSVSVTVVAVNSQRIYVVGEVQHVGPLDMATTMSPLQAIAAAGGLTPYANEKGIYILRGPEGKQQKVPFNYKNALKGKPHSAITLLAGDTIVVP